MIKNELASELMEFIFLNLREIFLASEANDKLVDEFFTENSLTTKYQSKDWKEFWQKNPNYDLNVLLGNNIKQWPTFTNDKYPLLNSLLFYSDVLEDMCEWFINKKLLGSSYTVKKWDSVICAIKLILNNSNYFRC